MHTKKIIFLFLLLGIFLIFRPVNVSAASVDEQAETEVGIHILQGNCPPSPEPPSPIVYKRTIVINGNLPKTGTVSSYKWVVLGSLLVILSVYIRYSFVIRDKKRGT